MALAWKVRDLLRFSRLTGNYRTQSMNKNIIRLAAIAALAVGAQAAIVKSATEPAAGFTVGGASTGGLQASENSFLNKVIQCRQRDEQRAELESSAQ